MRDTYYKHMTLVVGGLVVDGQEINPASLGAAEAVEPLGSISSPKGGDVIDKEARRAIRSIIARLENANIIKED